MAAQIKRPHPTKDIILALAGGNNDLLGCMHHGLAEVPLDRAYPVLNLDEIAAFAASSWRRRERDSTGFSSFVEGASLYGIFNEIYGIGMPWLNKRKRIPDLMKPDYAKLNPFQGKNLKERLELIDSEVVSSIKAKLQKPVQQWVFECGNEDAIRERGGENSRINAMGFQNVYPKKERIGPAYAAEIGRMLARYPGEIIPLGQIRTPTPTQTYPLPAQGSLF